MLLHLLIKEMRIKKERKRAILISRLWKKELITDVKWKFPFYFPFIHNSYEIKQYFC